MNDGFKTTLVMLIITLPISVIFIVAGIYIPKKITPKYIKKKEKYIDKSGKTRLRLIHLFEE